MQIRTEADKDSMSDYNAHVVSRHCWAGLPHKLQTCYIMMIFRLAYRSLRTAIRGPAPNKWTHFCQICSGFSVESLT
jgi:hypothetical protein